MNERVRIYVHKTARKIQARQALSIADKVGNAAGIHELKYPIEPIPDSVRTAVVFGGDGSYRSVVNAMMERDDPGVVVATKAGSQNAFHGSLVTEGSTIQLSEIGDAHQADIRPFKPARLNEHTFCYFAEVGRAAKPWSVRNESYRNSRIPRGVRTFAALLQTGLEESLRDTDEPLGYGFITAGDFKSHPILPGQSIYSEGLLKVTVPAMNPGELVQTAGRLLFGFATNRAVSEDLFPVERSTEFTIPAQNITHVALGGDVFPLDPEIIKKQDGNLYVARRDKSIHPAALVTYGK